MGADDPEVPSGPPGIKVVVSNYTDNFGNAVLIVVTPVSDPLTNLTPNMVSASNFEADFSLSESGTYSIAVAIGNSLPSNGIFNDAMDKRTVKVVSIDGSEFTTVSGLSYNNVQVDFENYT